MLVVEKPAIYLSAINLVQCARWYIRFVPEMADAR